LISTSYIRGRFDDEDDDSIEEIDEVNC